ncbi:beta-1,6-N-acetylglucosaminyltransferase [Massilia soli]|uniref:Peptide O-xylosyltransferase n=1 Tax=Massilia soli TaxID=2792854 RepID=A0ABS7SKW5_9BURK|nr:beta-1,6-N-acetylglucosaminyltransferase [Massilia soli]MBZ2206829.1 beta-1,6-N-acetylglucosaminyltransferase [Massilia soli]
MKQVILIHAHKDLGQLNALVGQLAHDGLILYVHVDAKSALDVARIDPRARQVRRRIAVHWGDWSQVRATLNSLAEIVAAVPAFDKVVFISAQDYPLLSNEALIAALDAARGSELLECAAIGPQGWACQERYQYFHWPRGGRLARLAGKLLLRSMRALGWRRAMAAGMRPFGGSCWWALSRPCIEMILQRIQAQPSIEAYFRTVACPDEMFFQTLVMDSPFASRVVSNNFRFIRWPDGGARNPKILDAGDFDEIARSGAQFCRKLDAAGSAGLLPLLERLRQDRN